jgi:hypothetical protein
MAEENGRWVRKALMSKTDQYVTPLA